MALAAVTELDVKTYSGPALKAFFNIAKLWKLSTEEKMALLGLGDRRSTLFHWKKHGGVIPVDTLERISHILGIYKSLQILLPGVSDDWVKKPNTAPLFGGRPALNRMMKSMWDLASVRHYLEGERGG
jgi:hypothetical protein